MASNETIADIVREMVEFGNHCAAFGGAYSPERWDNLCKRLNAAHNRELAAKDDERLTIVAMYENVIAAKDAEIAKLRPLTTQTDNSEVIAELQRRLKEAEEFAAEMKESTNSLVRACGHQMILRLQGEGGNDAH